MAVFGTTCSVQVDINLTDRDIEARNNFQHITLNRKTVNNGTPCGITLYKYVISLIKRSPIRFTGEKDFSERIYWGLFTNLNSG